MSKSKSEKKINRPIANQFNEDRKEKQYNKKIKILFPILATCLMLFSVIGIFTVFIFIFEYFYGTKANVTHSESEVNANSVYPYPYVMYKAPPNVNEEVYFPAKNGTMEKNIVITESHGYRYQPFDPVPKPNSIRGFILGGSTVFLGGTNETTISGYLEQKIKSEINDPTVTVEIINTGFLGAISSQELSLLVHEVIDFKPDFIIIFDGFNDMVHPFQTEPNIGWPIHWRTYKKLILEGKSIINRIENQSSIFNMLSASAFCRMVFGMPSFSESIEMQSVDDEEIPEIVKEYQKKIATSGVHSSEYTREEQEFIINHLPSINEVISHLLKNYDKMIEFSACFNIDSIVVLQPCNQFPIYLDDSSYYEKVRNMISQKANIVMQVNKTNKAQCLFLDGTDWLKGNENLYWDQVHFYDEGNEIVSDTLLNIIKETGFIEKWKLNN